MKFSKMILSIFVLFILTIGLTFYVAYTSADNIACDTASSNCGKCGDRYCNPRCGENEITCPKDCKLSPSGK